MVAWDIDWDSICKLDFTKKDQTFKLSFQSKTARPRVSIEF